MTTEKYLGVGILMGWKDGWPSHLFLFFYPTSNTKINISIHDAPWLRTQVMRWGRKCGFSVPFTLANAWALQSFQLYWRVSSLQECDTLSKAMSKIDTWFSLKKINTQITFPCTENSINSKENSKHHQPIFLRSAHHPLLELSLKTPSHTSPSIV